MNQHRNIIEIVNKLQSVSFEEIKSSELAIELLWAYSKLFNNGKEPSWCVRCMKGYYQEIIKNGTKMAEKLTEAENRTCKPNWNGLKYIHKAGRHYSNLYITDKEAIYLLENNLINEDQFDILPVDYTKNIEVGAIPMPEIEKKSTKKNNKK